jgi:hypothetical protein
VQRPVGVSAPPALGYKLLAEWGTCPRRRLGGAQRACGGYLNLPPHEAILRFADVKKFLIVALGVTTESVSARVM